MRTQTDLAAAFALIEASMDEYAAPAEPATAQVVELLSDRPRPTTRRTTSRRRRLAVVASVAAAASAAALVVALAGLGSSRPVPAGSDGPSALGPDGRSLPFTIAQSTGLQIIDVENIAAGRLVELAGPSAHFKAWVGQPPDGTRISPGFEAVTIGDLPGYYDDGSDSPLELPSAASPSPSATATPGFQQQPAVVWEYAPKSFVVVDGVDPDSPPSKAQLLEAARGIQLTSSVPLTLSFRLAASPLLGDLERVSSSSRSTNSSAPYTITDGVTACGVSYGLAASSNGVGVTVYHSVQYMDGGSGVPVVVDGHRAWWDVHFHQLVVDAGNNTYVHIVEENFIGHYTWSLPQYEKVFGLITLAPDVADPSTWISAQDLP